MRVKERGLSSTTDELYLWLLRLYVLPTFRAWDLDEGSPPSGPRSSTSTPTLERQKEVAAGIDARVAADRKAAKTAVRRATIKHRARIWHETLREV